MNKVFFLFILFYSVCNLGAYSFTAPVEQKFSIEAGGTKEFLNGSNEGQSTFLASYLIQQDIKKSEDYIGFGFFEIIGGTLNGDRATNFLFAGLGYGYELKHTNWAKKYYLDGLWFRASASVGYITKTSNHLSSHNMFSEAIVIGWERVFITYRHMSNGGSAFHNSEPNSGEDNFTIGLNVLKF